MANKRVLSATATAARKVGRKVSDAIGGLMADASASADAPPSIYDALERDHAEVRRMLSEIAETSARAAKTRERRFEQLKAALTAHSRAEEKVFYDAIKMDKEGRGDALEGYEEHHVVDVLLRELARLSPGDERWTAKFAVLKECIEHHVEEEEGEMFTQARKILSDEEAEELGARFVSERSKRLAKVP